MAGGTSQALPLHVQIRRKLNGNVSTDWLSRSIFKVPHHLRRISKHAYEPQVISIGPYHHGQDQLKKMEEYKTFYLKMLLWRRRESSLERYVTALKGMEEEAREFYSEPLDHIGGEEFVEMMLLDGCFIIELIRKSAMDEQRDEKDHLLTHFILRRTMLDLLLVENQLPFFILSKLFNMTVMPDDEAKDFLDMAIKFFSKIMPGSLGRPEDQDIKHLLGLLHDSSLATSPDCPKVHISCLPEKVTRSLCPEVMLKAMAIPCLSSPSKSAEEDEESESAENSKEQITQIPPPSTAAPSVGVSASNSLALTGVAQMSGPLIKFPRPNSSEEVRRPPQKAMRPMPSSAEPNPLQLVRIPPPKPQLDSRDSSDPNRKEWRFIRSATELREAGINFQKIEGRLFDIKFQKGVMLIPTLSINDDTESILRNLVAYEQCFKGASSKCFTDYITFMDCLINTGKDVELLCLRGVIDNWLGDHEVVAAIFNKLRDCVMISEEDFTYAENFKKVNEHCDRKWNQWKANLWHNYFNTPWAGISFFAAVVLLLFTVLQGVYSVLSYDHQSK